MAAATQAPRAGRHWAVWANILPVVGVLLFDWSVASVLAFFWLENVLVGVRNAIRMAGVEAPDYPPLAKYGLTAFFSLHYGMFCLIHGAFVYGFIEREGIPPATLYVSIAPLLALHGADAARARRLDPTWRTGDPFALMFQPYGRVLVLQGTLLLGGMLWLEFAWPVGLLVILIGLKTLAEILSDRDPNGLFRV